MNNTITNDQLDTLTLPLGKAKGILWCVLDSMDGVHQMDAVYAAIDMIDATREVAKSLTDGNTPEEKGAKS